MQIIGGIVSHEDGVKTIAGDQFSPTRKVRVELNFSLDKGEGDDAIAAVLDKAQAFVNGKLGLAVPTAAAKTVAAPAPKAVQAEALAPTVNDKERLAQAAGVVATTPKRGPGRPKATAPVADPDELVPSTPIADAMHAENEKAQALNDDISDLIGDDKPKEITDADLNHAIQQKMQEITSPENPGGPRIRKLTAEYIGDGTKQPHVRHVPQEKRAAFLKALEALKK